MIYNLKFMFINMSKLMKTTTRTIRKNKNIALVAHDNMKHSLIKWAKTNQEVLSKHNIYATGTTGHLIEQKTKLKITKLVSGPLGGDQQLGARITEGKIDMLFFFWDPLNVAPHDPDVKALLRISTVWNIPIATNISSANYLISSNLIDSEQQIKVPDYLTYIQERTQN